MDKIRLGIVGMGNIGKYHAENVVTGKIARCELTVVCSTSPDKLNGWRDRRAKVFGDAQELFRSGLVDGVVLATPHFQHAPLAMEAFQHGLHVMCEKPIAAHKADAERMIAAHGEHPELIFAGMFQFRAEPRFLAIKKLMQEGALGEMVRFNWINTDWYRTEAYYTSSAWRATWQGEGGGVLLNQCLHNLDTLQWLCGMPQSVRGFCQFGRFHKIEVEDSVTAYLEWKNGATGAFISSTGETPGTNRLEIAGTRGSLVLENEKLTLTRNEVDMIEFSKTSKEGFIKPPSRKEEIPLGTEAAPHAVLLRNFVEAILDGQPLIAPGAEGIHSLELANAVVYSSLQNETVSLPLDGAVWEKKLNELIGQSAVRKKTPGG
jgi:predicted dehydrogenase